MTVDTRARVWRGRRRRAAAKGGEQALLDPGGAGDSNPARFRFEPTPEREALSMGAYLDEEALTKVIQIYDEGLAGDTMGGETTTSSLSSPHARRATRSATGGRTTCSA